MRSIQNRHHTVDDLLDRREAAGTVGLASHLPDFRIDDVNAAARKCLEICLNRRMLPHARVHCGSNDYGSGYGQMECREEIVGHSICKLGNAIGGGRCDQKQVRGLRHKNVIESAFEVAAGSLAFKDVDVNLVARQRAECQRGHKLRRALRHQDCDVDAAVLKPSDDLG